jgi:hypothetical protein
MKPKALTPDEKQPRGIIITSGTPRVPRMPFWAYLWSAADEPDEEPHRRGPDHPSGPALASTG